MTTKRKWLPLREIELRAALEQLGFKKSHQHNDNEEDDGEPNTDQAISQARRHFMEDQI